MNFAALRLNANGAKLVSLLGTASLLTMANTLARPERVYAAEAITASEEVPENVLITGSLIPGTPSVGVPVTNLTPRDFVRTGALTTADLFRTVPAFNVLPIGAATNSANIERAARVNLRGLDSGAATRSLLLIDGMRFPPQTSGLCAIDPSIIPAIALDHIDILADGASATYGSDAVSGVINLVLKRNLDGAITQLRYTTAEGGKNRYLASQSWGRVWDGGQITLSYEWYNDSPTMGNAHSNLTVDYAPWGLDDRRPLGSSAPATLSIGAPVRPGGGKVGTDATLGHGCTNCYAVPLGSGSDFNAINGGIGPTAPFSASTLNWSSFNSASNSGSNGVRNQFNPYQKGWYDAAQQRNAAVITIDQRLTKDISFYGEGFYSNRRSEFYNPSNDAGSAVNNLLQAVAVPTTNPYYPIGGAPANLRVNYNIAVENPSFTSAYELAGRYQLGLKIALPAGWDGQLWYAQTNESNGYHVTGVVNKNAISAALGWTIGATTPLAGTAPALGSWTKPSSVPYLNLFCDATLFKCNSDATLAYVSAARFQREQFTINEKGVTADGPLFDLPAGTAKAAVGATFTSSHFDSMGVAGVNAPSLIPPIQTLWEAHQVWAIFGQVNVPIFSEANAIPLFRRLELEASWRHDQYSNVGGTSNPKLAFNWAPVEDLTVRGSWGTSFRAPNIGELSARSARIDGYNLGALSSSPNASVPTVCTPGASLPPAGSGAWKVQSSAGNGTPGSAAACVGSLTLPPGISISGGSDAAAPIRAGGFNGWDGLKPEQATNWGIGFDYAPSGSFLRGLNIQATYYIIKLTRRLFSFGNTNTFNNPQFGSFAYLVPTDWLGSGLPGAAGCTNNLAPTTCAPFQAAVAGLLANPASNVSPQAQTLILWINDGGTFNKGWQKIDGLDWSVSYDWDWGNFGAFNAGWIGTYYLHNKMENIPGAPGSVIDDAFHTTVNLADVNQSNGVGVLPRMRYRARLAWTGGPWNVTGFMDYQSHFYHSQNPPPNVNGNFCAANGGLDANGGGGTFPCAISDYSNLQPSFYTFDFSLGYDTMDRPANPYLRNIGIQFVIQNILDRHSPFEYRISVGGGNPAAMDILKSNLGRMSSIIVTKTW